MEDRFKQSVRPGDRSSRTVRRFEDLEIFATARELTKKIYETTRQSRFARDMALGSQIRRSAVSIMSNVAEGFERDGDKEFAQFLSQAKGSCGELRAQLYVAIDQGYLPNESFDSVLETATRINRMISRLMAYLGTSSMRGRKFVPGRSRLRI